MTKDDEHKLLVASANLRAITQEVLGQIKDDNVELIDDGRYVSISRKAVDLAEFGFESEYLDGTDSFTLTLRNLNLGTIQDEGMSTEEQNTQKKQFSLNGVSPPESDYSLKHSGDQQVFETGSKRDTQVGKIRPDLIPISVLVQLSEHYRAGADHYGDHNWKRGQPVSRYYASLMRHLWACMLRKTDENHIVAVIWNAIAICYTLDAVKKSELPSSLDDRESMY